MTGTDGAAAVTGEAAPETGTPVKAAPQDDGDDPGNGDDRDDNEEGAADALAEAGRA